MKKSRFFDNSKDKSFLAELKASLSTCIGFDWTVSFIKKAGLILLLEDIENALERGAKGRILTSTYQNFTDVGSLEEFIRLQEEYPGRFECHLENDSFHENGVPSGFHTKGYLFHYGDHEQILIGSSNITRFALCYNKEWDIGVCDDHDAPFYLEVQKEFDHLWSKTGLKLNREDVKAYMARLQYAISAWDMDGYVLDRLGRYKPNAMQRNALKEIRKLRAMNVDRALIVAATGSGKTFLSAFDALEAGAKRLLFIVHKDMILQKSMETYMHVFSNNRTYGMFTGDEKQSDADFVFGTNVSIAGHLNLFAPDEFDYIVIDEVHHASASTYQKIIDYFKPGFLLGMTATPDRMDKEDIYAIFENNVPYDLRLRDAIENELIVPFHYYGIKDQYLDYDDKDIAAGASKLVQGLIAEKHIDFLLDNIDAHRPVGMGKLKCVGFCRTVEHARLLADLFNLRGREAISLSGKNTLAERMEAFHQLEDESSPVEYLFAVDILNEGVDIQSMNMALFLRPTESSTIFIQQLGRGLRKFMSKPYLTVLDFIGNNYTRAAQIALAFGGLTKVGGTDPRIVTRLVKDPMKVIDLPSVVIEFDEMSQSEILESLAKTPLNGLRYLKSDYNNYKKYLIENGEISSEEFPRPIHFLNASVPMDMMRFVNGNYSSYYEFIRAADPDHAPIFSDDQLKILATLTFYLPLVRNEEFDILNLLLEHPMFEDEIQSCLSINIGYQSESVHHALMMLSGNCKVNAGNMFVPLIKKYPNGEYAFVIELQDDPFSQAIKDTVEYGLVRYAAEFYGKKGLLKRFGYYSGAKAFLALNNVISGTEMPNLYYESGVQYTNNGLCLFINLNKDASVEERLNYKDKFISRSVLQWESQTGTTIDNSKGQRLIKTKYAHVFVRTSKKGNPPFVYLGEGELTNPRDANNPAKALLFDIKLEEEIPEEYDYDVGYQEII